MKSPASVGHAPISDSTVTNQQSRSGIFLGRLLYSAVRAARRRPRHCVCVAALPLPSVIPVSGVSFRQAELRDVVEGDHLAVVATDSNPHDANACEVRTTSGSLLGFVPKSLAVRLRERGETTWTGVVSEILRGEVWGLRVRLYPSDMEAPTSVRDAYMESRAARNKPRESGSAIPGRDHSAPVALGPVRVKALSGRDLGVLVRVDDGRVVVVQNDKEVSYPAGIVTIEGR